MNAEISGFKTRPSLFMKKFPETSRKARMARGYWKHLRPDGKRQANKATRKLNKRIES